MENDSGRRFPPAPKSGSASTPTLPTTPAAVACGYPYVAWGERMPVATVARTGNHVDYQLGLFAVFGAYQQLMVSSGSAVLSF